MISKELRNIFSQAVGYAKSSNHEYLTLEHIFLMLIHDESIENLFVDLGVDSNKLFDDTKKYIEENTPVLPEGVEDEPLETVSLTSTIEYMVAHTQTSGKANASVEDMFVAILKDEKSYATYLIHTLGIEKVDILEEFSHNEPAQSEDEAEEKNNKVLDKNSTELVALAQKGEIDPVIGREREISRVIEVLSRRKKNNPILIGEPGVGKSAIAEGLARDFTAGRYRVGERLPGERDMADGLGVSVGTLRRALAELEASLGEGSIVDLIRRFEGADFSSADVLAVVVAGLRGGGWEGRASDLLHADIEGGPLTAAKAAALLLARAFVLPDEGADASL
mgnify:CR=1 FL=1